MLTGLLMAFIYLLTILIGVQSLGQFELSENGGIALSDADYYLGRMGTGSSPSRSRSPASRPPSGL